MNFEEFDLKIKARSEIKEGEPMPSSINNMPDFLELKETIEESMASENELINTLYDNRTKIGDGVKEDITKAIQIARKEDIPEQVLIEAEAQSPIPPRQEGGEIYVLAEEDEFSDDL